MSDRKNELKEQIKQQLQDRIEPNKVKIRQEARSLARKYQTAMTNKK